MHTDSMAPTTTLRYAIYTIVVENGLNALTVCAWAKTTFGSPQNSWTDNWSLVDFDRSEYFSLSIRGDDGRVAFSTATNLNNQRSVGDMSSHRSGLNDGGWHFVCGVYDGRDKIIYVDGVEDGRAVNPHEGAGLGTGATRYGFIGDGSEADGFNGNRNQLHYDGLIDEVRIYHEALSADKIRDLFGNTLPVCTVESEEAICDADFPRIVAAYPHADAVVPTQGQDVRLKVVYASANGLQKENIRIRNEFDVDLTSNAKIGANALDLNLGALRDGTYEYTITLVDSENRTLEKVLTFEVDATLPTSRANLPTDVYDNPQEVSLSCSERGQIYYSLDGYPTLDWSGKHNECILRGQYAARWWAFGFAPTCPPAAHGKRHGAVLLCGRPGR